MDSVRALSNPHRTLRPQSSTSQPRGLPLPPRNFQPLLPINQHAPPLAVPAIPAPEIIRNHGARKRALRVLQHLLVERARLQPDGADAGVLGLLEQLQGDGRRRDDGERGLGGGRERGGRGGGGVVAVEGGDGGIAGVERRDGEGVRQVPYEDYWRSLARRVPGAGQCEWACPKL